MSDRVAALEAADRRLLAAARDIKVLSLLSWPASVRDGFMQRWQAGNPALPEPEYEPVDYAAQEAELRAIDKSLDRQDPVGRYQSETARSYLTMARLLDSRGSAQLTDYSVLLYGKPGDSLPGGEGLSNIEAARHFIRNADEYGRQFELHDEDYCLSAQLLRKEMARELDAVFGPGVVSIEIDPALVSKAAAGATRVRLREGTCFSEYDLQQLLQHEAFVHSLTALNGRAQPHLKSMGLGSPRTTATQEGLATFSELITGAIDMARLQRISLRIIAVDMALNGADFLDVFRFFLEHGQVELESFNSAMRVFRGVPVTGGAAFTKDVVYLQGLMTVHTFFRWAMREQKLRLCRSLFAGRMTVPDVIHLEPEFDSGVLGEPRYLPPWMTRTNGLAGYLAFSVFANRLSLKSVEKAELAPDPATLDALA